MVSLNFKNVLLKDKGKWYVEFLLNFMVKIVPNMLIVYCNARAVGHYPTHSISTKSSFHFSCYTQWMANTHWASRGKKKKDAKHFKKQNAAGMSISMLKKPLLVQRKIFA
jgi:hypothetical protein